jgi:hypothetical protein
MMTFDFMAMMSSMLATLVVKTSLVTRPLSGIIPVDSVTSPRETNFDKTFAATVTGRRDPHVDASARGGDLFMAKTGDFLMAMNRHDWPGHKGHEGPHRRGVGRTCDRALELLGP